MVKLYLPHRVLPSDVKITIHKTIFCLLFCTGLSQQWRNTQTRRVCQEGAEGTKLQENAEKYIMRSFIIWTRQILLQ
jgi:hypothetical protein